MTTLTPDQLDWFSDTFAKMVGNVERAVLGKPEAVALAVCCLVSEGHLLLDDVPGTGKTSLAKALANTVDGTQSRVQFTPDLLPSDVTGGTIFNQATRELEFQEGPIFASIVLIDEINRASPKTQSALLEVMEEGTVTVNKVKHRVAESFMVIATQNPVEQAGVYPLPEAQLDRFLMCTSLGYPDHSTTVALLAEAAVRDRTASVGSILSSDLLRQMGELASLVHTEESVLDYIAEIAEKSRPDMSPHVKLGVSTRACLSMVRAAKTWAAANHRNYVLPDDVRFLAQPVLAHRIALTPDAEFAGLTNKTFIANVLDEVEIPASRVA
jgi:MoxR-like ATPase